MAAAVALAAAALAAPPAYDYVVVGAGAGGCPVAAKLAQAGATVLLLEAGPDDDWKSPGGVDPLVPANADALLGTEGMEDSVVTEPTWQFPRSWAAHFPPAPPKVIEDFANRSGDGLGVSTRLGEFQPRARIVGGCTMHNFMVFLRGSPEIYQAWGDKWEWEVIMDKFIKMENHTCPNSDDGYHGHDGECYVSVVDGITPADKAWMEAANLANHTRNDDFNGVTRVGAGPYPTSIKDGMRWSASKAFLTPKVRALPNFKLVTYAMATKVVFNGSRAIGVNYVKYLANGTQAQGVQFAAATKEVILSAGAFRSPQLLMLSGVGPAEVLAKFAIPTVVASEVVGKHLQDHLMTNIESTAKSRAVPPPSYNTIPVGALFYSSWCKARNCTHHDLQLMCGSEGPGMFCLPGLVGSIQSDTGYLTLASTDPAVYPAIYPNYVTAQADIDRLAEAMQVGHSIFQQDPKMFPFSLPLPGNLTEAVMKKATTIYHPVGTCRMGPSSDKAVVDPELRVYGVQSLRVIDASIMPLITNVNTDATTRMIGFHAADLILGAAAGSPP